MNLLNPEVRLVSAWRTLYATAANQLMGAEDVLLPTKKKLASTSGVISVGRKHGLLLDRNPYPLNAVLQVSEHQQEVIFPQAEPNPRRALVQMFNTQEAPDQESGQREMEKRLHEAKLAGTRSNPAVNEMHLPVPMAGNDREGTTYRRSKAGLTHLPCDPLESRTRKSAAVIPPPKGGG